jgi:DNA-binding SARP family transcriptional activator
MSDDRGVRSAARCNDRGRGRDGRCDVDSRAAASVMRATATHGAPDGPQNRDPQALLRRAMYALDVVGDLRDARVWFDDAYYAAQRTGDYEIMAEAALGLGGLWVYEQRGYGHLARTVAMQREALAVVPPDSVLALRLRTRLAAESDYHIGESTRVLSQLADARRHGDPQAVASALSLAHHCLLGPEYGNARYDLARELLLTADRTGRHTDRLMGLLWRTVDLFMDGDPHAERSLGELLDALCRQDHRAIRFVTQAMEVMLTIRAGDFDRAEALAAECAKLGEASGDADSPVWFRGQMLAIRWFQGRVGELLPAVLQEAHSPALGPIDDSQFGALAAIAAAEGDHRLAAGALARLGRGDLTRVPSGSAWLVTVYAAVEAAAQLGDTQTAAMAYRLLRPHERLPIIGGLGVVCFGSVEHALGVASLTLDNPDRAVAHLRPAIKENLALGHWPAACLSRHRLVQALTLRGLPGDEVEAASELAVAQREAEELGMRLPEPRTPPQARAVLSSPLAVVPTVVGTAVVGPDAEAPAAEPPAPVAAPAVQVRLLGPVDLVVGDEVRDVPGARRKAVLATLALYGGEAVSSDRVIAAVWGESPPATATNTLQRHVSHLRGLFGSRTVILSRGTGYALNLDGDATDVAVAERLIDLGTTATDAAERAAHLQAAVRLWRGPALMDLAGSSWLEEQAERLGQLLVRARHALAGARLDLGRHDEALADLEELAREHPLHEQIHASLMLALYRSGRQSDALAVYRRLRAALRDDLGLEPSQPLRELEAAVLRQDETLNRRVPGR